MRTSPLDSLEAHTFLLPALLLIQDILYRSALCLARLLKFHPLHQKMKWIEHHDVKHHHSVLHNLIHTLQVMPSKIETSNPCTLHPNAIFPFSISIAPNDKASAIEDYKKNTNITKIFTDGSSTNRKVGASAVLYINNRQVAKLQYHLGAASKHTVFKAKLLGMILAAHLLATNQAAPLPASIFVDNQAAILAGEQPLSKPGHYLSIKFREIMQEVFEQCNLSKCDITIHWIVGHRNIQGNEEADREAKRAATDKNSLTPIDQLPMALHMKLPISTSALKQEHRKDLKKKWQKTWEKSKCHTHITTINSMTPSKKYLKATRFMPKSRSGVIFQLCSGHIALNK